MARVPQHVVQLAGELRGVIGQLRRRLRQVDNADVLTPTQSAVLARLHREGPATQAQLAAAEHVRQQSMAATLGALTELGYLERNRDSHDARRVVISLSSLGDRTVRGLIQHREEWLAAELSSGFTEEERRKVVEAIPLLRRLAERE